jgi:hypothetical protein
MPHDSKRPPHRAGGARVPYHLRMPPHSTSDLAFPSSTPAVPVRATGYPIVEQVAWDTVDVDDVRLTTEDGQRLPISAPAAGLLSTWLDARQTWPSRLRVLLLEAVLLTALHGSTAEGCATLTDVLTAEDAPESTSPEWLALRQLLTVGYPSSDALCAAWDAATACPYGYGLPPLSAIRPDLPLQRGFRALTAEEKLVFFAFAPRAAHQVVLSDAKVLARRAGLDVPAVHLALATLVERRWLQRHTDLAPGVLSVARYLLVPFPRGPWGRLRSAA